MNNYHRAKYREKKLREIPEDLKVAINSLYYDQGLDAKTITLRLQVSAEKIKQALMRTRADWNEYRAMYQVRG